ncbi:MAG: HAD family hydrolase [Candidatus Heimdallarchaeota archaeon]
MEENHETIDETEVILEEAEEELEEQEEIEEVQMDDTPWIFFDYSGTLVDTVDALSRTYTKFLSRDFPPDQVKSLYKDFPKMSKVALLRKYKFNPFKYLIVGKNKLEEIRKEEFWEGVRAFPGIPEVLMRLQKIVNAKLAIVTHETELLDPEERVKIFQRFGIPIQFNEVIADSSNKEENFDLLVQNKGIAYGIIIGDNQFDIDLGKKHNFYTIGVTWGFSTRDEFTADYIIDDPQEILQVVMSLMHQIEQKKLHGDPI